MRQMLYGMGPISRPSRVFAARFGMAYTHRHTESRNSVDVFATDALPGHDECHEVQVSDTVKVARTQYFVVGVSQTITSRWTVGVDAYYKRITILLDEGQFGQALILTPFNYAERPRARCRVLNHLLE